MGNMLHRGSPNVAPDWALVAKERKEAYEKLEEARRVADGRLESVRAELDAARAASHRKELEEALFKLDVANGTVRTRAQLEAFFCSIMDACKPIHKAVPPTPSGKQSLLLDGTFLPALVSYISVTAEENGAQAGKVLQRARGLYGILSAPLHALSEGGTPTEVFGEPQLDREAIIAYAAIARFAKRDPSLYSRGGRRYELRMRAPPSDPRASLEAVRAGPELPPVAVCTGVLRGAEGGDGGGDGSGGSGGGGGGGGLASPREP
jgi:hypothetical protein